jgi:hypothetical protein
MSETVSAPFDRGSHLYHYTSAQGLAGILASRCLWATDSAFLNDWREIKYAAEPLIERLARHIGGRVSEEPSDLHPETTDDNRLVVMQSALMAIQRFMELPPSEHRHTYIDGATYVACLSEDHDQLGQWRAYGKSGYAIGFQRDALISAAPLVGPVGYGEAAVGSLCDEVISYLESRPPTAHPGTHGFFDAVNYCMPRLALVKHDAFAQEKEWRLVHSRYNQALEDVKVRTAPILIPYVECPFDDSALMEIVIGPGGTVHSERAVRALLTAHGFHPNSIAITQSRAPFRG